MTRGDWCNAIQLSNYALRVVRDAATVYRPGNSRRLGSIPVAVARGLPGARWIDPENYHLTLRFIGDVDDEIAQEIAWLLGKGQRKDCELRLDGLQSFGGRKPRAIVAAVAPSQSLMDLQAEHERLMQRVGLDPEGRKYTPHVTLARLHDTSSFDVAEYLSARAAFRSEPFTVLRFVLFSARASVGGGPYVVEAAYPLAT